MIFGYEKGILERGRQRLDAAAGFFNLLRHSLRLRLLYPALRAPRHANHHVYWSMVGRVCAAAGWELKALVNRWAGEVELTDLELVSLAD